MSLEAIKALQFFATCGKLKTLKRTGWVNNNVTLPESVADHMYRMSMMCFALKDPGLNKDRLIKICLCHDLAEAIAALGSEIRDLWFEYEERTTDEAKVASQLDKFEMIVQADEYEKQHAAEGKRLDSFFSYTEGYFTHPEVGAWDQALREQRRQRLSK
eukprot:GSChrysophyteH1.ASY1.ANO1.400.1 assembled CDS